MSRQQLSVLIPAMNEEANIEECIGSVRWADEVVVVASVAGLKPADIDICLKGSLLSIEGTFAPPVTNVDYVLRERENGRFSRKLALSVDVDARKATATIRDGLLTVVLPKALDSHSADVRVPVEA